MKTLFKLIFCMLVCVTLVWPQVRCYLEINCLSKQEQYEIKKLLCEQQWVCKENIFETEQSLLIGPYDLDKAQTLQKKLEQELNLVSNLNISMLEFDLGGSSWCFQDVDVQDDEMIVSQYDKEVTSDTLKLYSDERIRKIINLALEFYTIPYKWGGTNLEAGIDCSYFVKYIFKKVGIDLPRTSREQFKIGELVNRDELQPGDLVFFKKTKYRKVKNKIKKYEYINHVGIYLKDNEFIHAARSAKKVIISSLDEPYYKKHYAGARRVIKNGI